MTDYCQFQLDSIARQNGWSDMTNDGAQPDSFTFCEHIDRGNSIVNNVSYTGNQSWWFKRGYGSAGSGTPYSPSIDNPTNDFEYSVWIKQVQVYRTVLNWQSSLETMQKPIEPVIISK